jgi:hypothetical protein
MLKSTARLLCALVLWPSAGRAQDVPAETLLQSNAMFAQGKRELDAGQVAAACSAFSESYRLMPRGGTLLNLGLCREREGRLAEAWRLLRAALSVAQREGRDDRVPLAREHIAALEGQLSFAAIALPHDIDPSLVALRLDGGAILREEWTGVPLEPGEHVVSAEAVGFQSWSTKFSIGSVPSRLVVSIGPLVPNSALALDAPPSGPTSYPGSAAYAPPGYAPYPSLPAQYAGRAEPEDPQKLAARLAERRLALEGWFVEAALGVTATRYSDDFMKTLRAFDYQESEKQRLNIDLSAGYMLSRNWGLVFHYNKLETTRYAVMNEDSSYSEQPSGTGKRYVYSWHTQALMAGVRFRQPLASHWVVLFADLNVGLAFTVSALEYELAAGSGFLSKRDNERDRSIALRGMAGFDFGILRHAGVFMAGGFTYAPTLTNSLDETHDAGGAVFLTGIRLNSVHGGW